MVLNFFAISFITICYFITMSFLLSKRFFWPVNCSSKSVIGNNIISGILNIFNFFIISWISISYLIAMSSVIFLSKTKVFQGSLILICFMLIVCPISTSKTKTIVCNYMVFSISQFTFDFLIIEMVSVCKMIRFSSTSSSFFSEDLMNQFVSFFYPELISCLNET